MAVEKRQKSVQGAYVSLETKKWIKKNWRKLGFHSPTDMAGSILEEYYQKAVQEKKDKREKVQ